jgi:hypothetical protein
MGFSYCVTVVAIFWNMDTDCADKLDTWLLVYTILIFLHIVRRIVLIIVWKKSLDPNVTQTQFDVFFILLVVCPELGIFIWGNTFIYSDEIEKCKNGEVGNNSRHVEQLWWCVFILIIYGYLFMLFSCCFCMIGSVMFYTLRAWTEIKDEEDVPSERRIRATERIADTTPFMSAMTKAFTDRKK